MSNKTATLSSLNANDNPADNGGILLSDDGENQLWLFGDKVANRYQAYDDRDGADASIIHWSDDVDGWGYSEDDTLDE